MAESLVIWTYFELGVFETTITDGEWGLTEAQWIEKAFMVHAAWEHFTEEETASTLADLLQNKDYELIGVFISQED